MTRQERVQHEVIRRIVEAAGMTARFVPKGGHRHAKVEIITRAGAVYRIALIGSGKGGTEEPANLARQQTNRLLREIAMREAA